MIVKICGIKKELEIDVVNKVLPEYIGYIFAKSKREINTKKALKLNKRLDKSIKKCGVFVNEKMSILVEKALIVKLDVIQLHGTEDIEYIRAIKKLNKGFEIWKGVNINNYDKYKNVSEVDKIIIDGTSPGSGNIFDWKMLKYKNIPEQNTIIAGGLNPNNIAKLLTEYKPFGVDVSSGVEKDGNKNYKLVNDFINKVRGASHENRKIR